MTALVLAHVGYRALQAMTGQQALAAVRLWEPDLVLLDLALPDLPGTQVCRQLRQLSPVPIMIVSTETDPGTIDLAMAAGASDYVRKPFRTVDLLARMELHLSTPRRPDGIARDRDPSRVAHPSP
jgi:DNA-binding response OmpR family regulator